MYPEPGPVRAVDQRITRYSFSPMRLKIHSAVRVWFAISRQVTRDGRGDVSDVLSTDRCIVALSVSTRFVESGEKTRA